MDNGVEFGISREGLKPRRSHTSLGRLQNLTNLKRRIETLNLAGYKLGHMPYWNLKRRIETYHYVLTLAYPHQLQNLKRRIETIDLQPCLYLL